jgi:hypothetical protein
MGTNVNINALSPAVLVSMPTGAEPFTPPTDSTVQKVPPYPDYPGLTPEPVDFLITQLAAAITAQGTAMNQAAISTFQYVANQYTSAQLAAWIAAGTPSSWVSAQVPPVAPNLPYAQQQTITRDPTVPGQGWWVFQPGTTPLGVCPVFTPPAPAAPLLYTGGYEGTYSMQASDGNMYAVPIWSAFDGTNVAPGAVVLAGPNMPTALKIENPNGPGPIPAAGPYQVMTWGTNFIVSLSGLPAGVHF